MEISQSLLNCCAVFVHCFRRILKATLEPQSRQKVIQDMLNQADEIEPGPCGNFTEMYRCICDYLGTAAREDIEWVSASGLGRTLSWGRGVVSLIESGQGMIVLKWFWACSPGKV